MRRLIVTLAAIIVSSVLWCTTTQALGLKVAPLEYRTVLKKGESQQGFIDVSNPTSQTVKVTASVRGFRQIDDQGNLEFYSDEQLQAGIRVDLTSFTLGPREAYRVYFAIDGTKLPVGDNYAAVFFTSAQPDAGNIEPQVRVGTLLSIVNQTPGERKASITGLNLSWFQFGSIHGSYSIKNTGDTKKSTGFYPDVTISTWPYQSQQHSTGSLVFAGRTRTHNFTTPSPWPGIYKVTVAYGDSQRSVYVLYLNGNTIIILALLAVVCLIGGSAMHHRRKRLR